MGNDAENNTEQKILVAAEHVFHEKGFDGARMQEIADKAGINKGLLHYYFKTKDSLFEAIFSVGNGKMMAHLETIFFLEIPLGEKIGRMVDQYMDLLAENPSLPRFVINELSKNPERFASKIISRNTLRTFSAFADSVQKEIKAGNIRPIDPRQLFMNVVSMILFPYVGSSLICAVVGLTDKEFYALMQERKAHIKIFLNELIKE